MSYSSRRQQVWGMLLAIASCTVVAGAQPVLPGDAETLQAYRQLMEGGSAEQQLATVHQMLGDARSRLTQGVGGRDSILAQAASWALALENDAVAMECWELMLAAPESRAGEFSARRMLGVTAAKRGRKAEAIEQLSQALSIARADASLSRMYHRSLIQVVHELAALYEAQGQFADAIACRGMLLDPGLAREIDAGTRQWVRLSNGRAAARAGDRDAEAEEWFGQYESSLAPGEGFARDLLKVRLTRIRALFGDDSDAMESELAALWLDPRFADLPESAEVGFGLARLIRDRGTEEDELLGFEIYSDIAHRMERLAAGLKEDRNDYAAAAHDYAEASKHLETALRFQVVLGEGVGRSEGALLAAIKYRDRFDVSQDTWFIPAIAQRLSERIAARGARDRLDREKAGE